MSYLQKYIILIYELQSLTRFIKILIIVKLILVIKGDIN
jgi:hypothetical protein